MLPLMGVVVPVVLWWASTGLVLFLVRRPPHSYGMTVCIASSLAALAVVCVWRVADSSGPTGALLGYVAGLMLWGWLEVTFLTGRLTGPNRAPCDGARPRYQQFQQGVMTSIHHELAVIALGSALLAGFWSSVNPVAAQTFLVLWVMRWSAKLNLFLGVPNMHEGFFPAHLVHLKSYIRKRRMNLLFPFTLFGGTTALWMLISSVSVAGWGTHEAFRLLLISTTLLLALLEHVFLMLPIQDERLWDWIRPDERGAVADGGRASVVVPVSVKPKAEALTSP